MPIDKEWRCAAHGEFVSPTKSCPYGCPETFVKREIRTAPGLHSDRTKRADWAVNALAEDYGYSDVMTSPSRTNSVAEYQTKTGRRIAAKPQFVEVPHAAPGFAYDKNIEVPKFNPGSLGMLPEPNSATILKGRKGRGIKTSIVHRPKDISV